MAKYATGNREDALDLVQDAMLGLVRRYSSKSPEDWTPLFYRILQNRIRDWHRKQKVRNQLHKWFDRSTGEDSREVENLPDLSTPDPGRQLASSAAGEAIGKALKGLSSRQQQTFMLRVWEGMNVARTAAAMGCSEGSVKTHYSRALRHLKENLEGHEP